MTINKCMASHGELLEHILAKQQNFAAKKCVGVTKQAEFLSLFE